MRARHRQEKLACVVLLLCVVTHGQSQKGEPQMSGRKARHLEGRVLDGVSRQPLESVHIRLLPSGKGVWSTDEEGRFTFWIPEDIAERIEIEHENHRTLSLDAKRGGLGDILLEPLPPGSVSPTSQPGELMPASQSVAPALVTADSRPKASGIGHAWSPWYRLGVGKAPGGYTLQKIEFWLTGDRACGAWAECRELARGDDQILWEFRLEGHNELGAPARTFSTAHIRVIYRAK